MSQPTEWGVPSGPPANPTAFASRSNGSLDALLSGHSGSSRPSYAVAGTIWEDTSTVGLVRFYFYDGTDDILLYTINTSGNTVEFSRAVPPGQVSAFAMNSAPTGWLKANGAAVSRTTYAALFAAIGTTFGAGDGSTTFNLPDLRGEFLRGWDDSRGVDSGRVFGSAQQASTVGASGSGTQIFLANAPNIDADADIATASVSRTGISGGTSASSSFAGGRHRPRNVALLHCIKF